MVEVEQIRGRTYIDGALLQDESGCNRIIRGRVIDIASPDNFGKVRSSRDRRFYVRVAEEFNFAPPEVLHQFVRYLMDARALVPMPAYGTVAYYPKGVEPEPENARTYDTNHGSHEALVGIKQGIWDPSDVLWDLSALFKNSYREGRGIFREARSLILAGYEVCV